MGDEGPRWHRWRELWASGPGEWNYVFERSDWTEARREDSMIANHYEDHYRGFEWEAAIPPDEVASKEVASLRQRSANLLRLAERIEEDLVSRGGSFGEEGQADHQRSRPKSE